MADLGTILLKISFILFYQAVDFSDGELNNSLEIVDNNKEISQINTTEVKEIEIKGLNKSLNKCKQRKMNQLKNVDCRNSDENSFARETRSTFDDLLLLQFEKNCIDPGHQSCTCYYPDHINVTVFELSTDEITRNASGVNGTGPSNCQDLQRFGYSLIGFYMVRFNTKRIKSIFCNFNKTIKTEINSLENRPNKNLKQVDDTTFSLKRIRFCGAFKSYRCKYFYSDHPDSSPLDRNTTKPTSCDDLGVIGHTLKGFYLVYFNSVKVQIVYCDFNKPSKEDQNRIKIPQKILTQSSSNLSKVVPFCDGFGSRPCSCYYSNSRDILQFELGSDEITQDASTSNGIGPASCQGLLSIGYTLAGFYLIRYRTGVIRITFCDFNQMLKVVRSQVTTLGSNLTQKTNMVQKTSKSITKSSFTLPLTIWTPTKSLRTSTSIANIKQLDVNTHAVKEKELAVKDHRQLSSTVPTSIQREIGNWDWENTLGKTTDKIKVSVNIKPSSIQSSKTASEILPNLSSAASSSSVSQLMIPQHLNGGEGRALKNEHGKCLSPTLSSLGNAALNRAKLIQTNCYRLKSYQFWKWEETRISNRYSKYISVPYNNLKQAIRTSDVFQFSLIVDDASQKWTVIPLSKDFSKFQLQIFEKCLGFEKDSDAEGLEVKTVPCNKQEKGQVWSFGESFPKMG